MNCFIISGKGFYVGTKFEDRKQVAHWSDKMADARPFNSSSANKLIQKLGIDAFIWKPYEQIRLDKNWEIVKQEVATNNRDWTAPSLRMWVARKSSDAVISDIKILSKATHKEFYTEEEAKAIAKEKNLILLEQIHAIVSK